MLVSAHGGVGECELVVVHQAAHVVGVHMGDVDLVDLLGLVAGSLQVGDQVAQRRAKQLGCAGVNQHQLGAGVDQVAVNGGFQWGRHKRVVERFFNLGWRGVGQQLVHRQVDCAIRQGRDFKVAQHRAKVARR